MKKELLYLPKIIIFICILSCSKENRKQNEQVDEHTKVISIMSDFIKQTDHLHSVISHITFLTLETNPDCLIRNIHKIHIHDSLIYISDHLDKLLVFDINGNFVRQIGNKGQGPGEYLEMRDFWINKDSRIEVLDFKQILLYDLNGDYISSKQFNLIGDTVYCNATHFAPAPGGGYYFWGGSGITDFNSKTPYYSMYHVDDNMQVQKGYFPVNLGNGGNHFRFTLYQDTLLIDPIPANFNIYQIDQTGVINSRYFFDFGDKSARKRLLEKKITSPNKMLIEEETNKVSQIHNFLENDNWIYTSFSLNQKIFNIIHSKTDNKNYILSTIPSYIKKDELRLWWGYAITNEYLISPLDLNLLKLEYDRLDPEYIKKIRLDFMETKDESDNPVLVFYHFKK